MKRTFIAAAISTAMLATAGAQAHPAVVQVGEEHETIGYVFAQHGYTGLFQETNHVHHMGAQAYAPVAGGTGLQVHDICMIMEGGEPAIDHAAWQTGHNDVFYNYLPWQTTDAGYDDVPAHWLTWIDDHMSIDLTATEDVAAACPGTFVEADTQIAKV